MKRILSLIIFCTVSFISTVQAQCSLKDETFTEGEKVTYDLYFKWGLLMPKAGSAILSGQKATHNNNPAWHYQLLYRTNGIVDKAFKVRDTIDCYFTPQQPYQLFSSKRTLEGGYYQTDNITFSYKDNKTNAHSLRRSLTAVKVDTNFVSNECMFDVLGALMQIRSLDWTKMKTGDQFPLRVVMGRDYISVSYKYVGQQIVERGDVKYRTRYFTVDILDEAFTQSKEAAEIWIGDDENHLPIKIRAKLKIGAAEAYYNSSSGLRHPLNSRFVISKR